MELSKILSVSGRPGLYKMLSQTKNGFIVESLQDGKRFPVFSHIRVSSLEEISIYSTSEEDIPLKDIFRKMYEHLDGKEAIDSKSSDKEIIAFFEEIVPEYDKEQVYLSDMKKVLSWYNQLLEKDMLDFSEEEEEEEEKKESDAGQEEVSEEEETSGENGDDEK